MIILVTTLELATLSMGASNEVESSAVSFNTRPHSPMGPCKSITVLIDSYMTVIEGLSDFLCIRPSPQCSIDKLKSRVKKGIHFLNKKRKKEK